CRGRPVACPASRDREWGSPRGERGHLWYCHRPPASSRSAQSSVPSGHPPQGSLGIHWTPLHWDILDAPTQRRWAGVAWLLSTSPLPPPLRSLRKFAYSPSSRSPVSHS